MVKKSLAPFVRQCRHFLTILRELTTHGEATNGVELSEDLLIEILARLPVKSLIRFKCVRKSWYALIESPIFISKHLKYYASSNNENCTLIKYWNRDSKGAIVSFLSKEARLHSSDVAMHFFHENVHVKNSKLKDILFYGPCNGIICVFGNYCWQGPNLNFFGAGRRGRSNDPFALWNPATRKIKHFRDSRLSYKDNPYASLKNIGFGFDTRSNAYKVIKIVNFHRQRSTGRLNENCSVEVYNSTTDSWGIIDAVPPTNNFKSAFSIYLNGFYYWWAFNSDEKFLLSFNFADEKFDKIPPPPDFNNSNVTALMSFNESIALANNAEDRTGLCLELLVLNMNGDDEEKSWTKMYKIPCRNVLLVGLLRSGEALMVLAVDHKDFDDELASYDPHTQRFKNMRGYDCSLMALNTFQMVNYVESLVSFKGAHELHPTNFQVNPSKRKRISCKRLSDFIARRNREEKHISCNWFQSI